MKARFVHRCTHVLDKEASIKFYEEALGFFLRRALLRQGAAAAIRR